ncbi:MAG: GNAT family N-acetyltransferase [Elusimicrobia bacterium]|nr:GNAT family N-acetyltransferase [Elusimicrobiota bacterium]
MADLETKRLVLEPIEPRHAAALFEPLRDAAIYRFIPRDPPSSVEKLAERYARLQAGDPDGKQAWLNFAVRLIEGPVYIGKVQATISADAADVAYLFSPRHWGQGYASEAVRALIDHLFAAYAVRVVRASLDTRNERSAALLERLGFARVGRADNADHFKGGPSHEFFYETVHEQWDSTVSLKT